MSEKSIRSQIFDAVNELFAVAPTKPGQILVVGCSTSEVLGQKIGTSGDIHPAKDLFEVLFEEITDSNTFWEEYQDDSRKNNEERCIKSETFLV